MGYADYVEKVSPKMAEFYRRRDAHVKNNRKVLKEFVVKRNSNLLGQKQYEMDKISYNAAKNTYNNTGNIFEAAKTFVKEELVQRKEHQKVVWQENRQLISDLKSPVYNAIKEMTNK